MAKKRLQLFIHWYNKTVVLACSFMSTQYCTDFEPIVVIDLLQTHFRSRVLKEDFAGGAFGKRNEDGNFDGFLGKIQRGAYDVALAHIHITHERFDSLGFTRPYYVGGVKLAVRKGGYEDVSSALIRPFRFAVWLVLLFSVGLCGLSMRFRARLAGIRVSLSSIAMILWGTFLQKGCRTDRCFRTPLFIWSLLSFMLAHWYMASLQSFLTSPARVPVISTLDELNSALSRRNPTRICLHENGLAQNAVETWASPLAERLQTALLQDREAKSRLDVCQLRLLQENHLVVLSDGARIHPAADGIQAHPQLQTSPENFDTILMAAASSRGAVSLPYFDQLFCTLMETGIFLRNISMREYTRASTPLEERGRARGESVLRSLAGFGFAYGAGIFGLISEVLTFRFRSSRKRSQVRSENRRIPKRAGSAVVP